MLVSEMYLLNSVILSVISSALLFKADKTRFAKLFKNGYLKVVVAVLHTGSRKFSSNVARAL